MVRARKFEQYLAEQASLSKSDLDQRTRRLREAGFIPVTGRGLNAAEITPKHGASLLLSLASERPASAAVAVEKYGQLTADGKTLHEAVTAILSDPLAAVASLTINRTWPSVEIHYKDGETVVFEDPQAVGRPFFNSIHFNGSLLSMLAMTFKTVDSSWTENKNE